METFTQVPGIGSEERTDHKAEQTAWSQMSLNSAMELLVLRADAASCRKNPYSFSLSAKLNISCNNTGQHTKCIRNQNS